jgi:hypothetical protein
MQANGIIWVEGPSDLIYIASWLNALDDALVRGRDYEIVWYGGSTFIHLNPQSNVEAKSFGNTDEDLTGLLSLFKLNPNWAFLVDSDTDIVRGHADPAMRKRQHTVNLQKDKFLKLCCEDARQTKVRRFLWRVDPHIEECIAKNKGLPPTDKINKAHKYQEAIKDKTSMEVKSELTPQALRQLERLIKTIHSWRNK